MLGGRLIKLLLKLTGKITIALREATTLNKKNRLAGRGGYNALIFRVSYQVLIFGPDKSTTVLL